MKNKQKEWHPATKPLKKKKKKKKEYADGTWKYINFSQIYECRNWETEHYSSVLEITVIFLEMHKW
jgi:hypothetical protein